MDLNVRHKTIRLLEENVENLHDLELGKELIVLTPKVQSTKLKVGMQGHLFKDNCIL